MSIQDVWNDEAVVRCTLCGDSTGLYDLCSCCHRCIDCVAEIGHARTRTVADELEEFNGR
jgi:hypothetical protein